MINGRGGALAAIPLGVSEVDLGLKVTTLVPAVAINCSYTAI